MRGHRVGAEQRLQAGVEFPVARAARGHRAGDARLQAAHDAALVAQQLEEEIGVVQAQVLLFNEGLMQARELGDALGDARARLALQPCALVQGAEIVLGDEGLGGGARSSR